MRRVTKTLNCGLNDGRRRCAVPSVAGPVWQGWPGTARETTERPAEQVAVGLVGGPIPPAGTRIDPRREVVFAVATVPADLVGPSHAAAMQRLAELGPGFAFVRRIRNDIITGCDGMTFPTCTVTGAITLNAGAR